MGRKHEFFFSGGEMRNGSCLRGENKRQWKKKNAKGNTNDISSIQHVTRKFHVVGVQTNGKEMYKKVCCTCKVVFR